MTLHSTFTFCRLIVAEFTELNEQNILKDTDVLGEVEPRTFHLEASTHSLKISRNIFTGLKHFCSAVTDIKDPKFLILYSLLDILVLVCDIFNSRTRTTEHNHNVEHLYSGQISVDFF